MKSTLVLLSVIISLFSLESFIRIKPQSEIKDYELKQNEEVPFLNGPTKKTQQYTGSSSRGAYDKSAYTFKYKEGNLDASGIRGCKGKNQNEIDFMLCSGTVSRNYDTIKIQAKTVYSKLYLVNVKKNGTIDTLTSDIQIELISKTLKKEYCPSLVTADDHRAYIVALPTNVSPEEIWKPVHEANTVGIFTYFKVKDSNGKSKVYPEGDYVLIGGNSLKVSK